MSEYIMTADNTTKPDIVALNEISGNAVTDVPAWQYTVKLLDVIRHITRLNYYMKLSLLLSEACVILLFYTEDLTDCFNMKSGKKALSLFKIYLFDLGLSYRLSGIKHYIRGLRGD